jgi:hypothetical protein
MWRMYTAVRAILACGLLGAGYGAVVGAIYGATLLVLPILGGFGDLPSELIGGAMYGIFFGAGYGFLGGVVGGGLGGPAGWGIGGLLGGLIPGFLLFRPSGGIDLLLVTGGILPGLFGGAIGVTVGRAIASRSPVRLGIPWLLRIVNTSPLVDWLWWRGDGPADHSSPTCSPRMPRSLENNPTHLLRIELPGTAAFEEEDAWSRGDDLLLYLPAAARCRAAWEEMEGDDLVRRCRRCGKNVYNLAGMSGWEARDFVREAEAQRGVRFYRRRDGTLITDDCPRGRQAKQIARVCTRVLIGLVFGVLAWLGGFWFAW